MLPFKYDELTPFYPVDNFIDMHDVQVNFPIIQEELLKNKVWLHWGSDNYDQSGHCKFLSGDWTICPLYFGNYSGEGMEMSANLTAAQKDELLNSLPLRFPATTALFKHFPRINFAGLSRLHPQSELAPHRHNNPHSFIFHLGLIIPEGGHCGLKVGDQVHTWTKAGEAIVFNDNLEHSAWNHSDEERVILYIDFLRPLEMFKRLMF